MSSRKNINDDSIAVNHFMCQNSRYHLLEIILHHIDRLCPMIRQWIEMLSRLVYAQWMSLLLGILLDLWLILCNCHQRYHVAWLLSFRPKGWISCSILSIFPFCVCTSVVSASWLWMRMFDHFWLRPSDLLFKRHSVRLRLETMDAKWCMMLMQKWTIFFEGLIKVNCKHWRGTRFYLRIVKILQSVPFWREAWQRRLDLHFQSVFYLLFCLQFGSSSIHSRMIVIYYVLFHQINYCREFPILQFFFILFPSTTFWSVSLSL